MKITGSDITMTSSHGELQRYARRESLSMWVGTERPNRSHGHHHHHNQDRVELSREAGKSGKPKDKTGCCTENNEGASLSPRLQLFKSIIERITGTKIKLMEGAQAPQGGDGAVVEQPEPGRGPEEAKSAGYGVSYEFYESYRESESMTFSAAGAVTTSDGRRIDFSLEQAMQRSFSSETSISIQAGDAIKKDPLVINLDGNAAQLGDSRFSFDIDADGNADQIASLGAGSGFLALDRNSDGVINDGSELFGAKTGNGFAELAQYDLDGNNWIDENDAVFSDLSVWKDPGNVDGSLLSLKESGVGAIYLGNIATPFTIKDASNSELGQVRASGIYLAEEGGVGSIQQLDLAV